MSIELIHLIIDAAILGILLVFYFEQRPEWQARKRVKAYQEAVRQAQEQGMSYWQARAHAAQLTGRLK